MKLLIFPDCHFGYGRGTELWEDSFELAAEALSRAGDVDSILLAGDVFDSRMPDLDTLTRTIQLLLGPVSQERNIAISEHGSKAAESISPLMRKGIPVVAIHGTHERRARGLLNPVQALERSGFLIYLHCNGVVCEKGGERVCVQGMSGVPEQYASNVLKEWGPKPQENCFNIFMIHQNIKKFVFSHAGLEMEELPPGFDLYVSGHIHDPQQFLFNSKPFIITGSLVPTQLTKESVKQRGFWIVDTASGGIEFVEFEKQRKVYYKAFAQAEQEQVEQYIENVLSTPHEKAPLIRIKLVGSIAENELRVRFHGKALLSFRKEVQEASAIKSLEEHKLSVQELGKQLLQKNLEKQDLKPELFETIFELLLNKKQKEALELLSSQQLSK